MLRLLVLLVALANGLYFAWAQGFLRELGFAPVQQSEPQRIVLQIRPEALRLQKPPTPQDERNVPSTAPPSAGIECLQSPFLDEGQSTALRATLDSLPAGSWVLEPVTESARWMVYMGPYTAADALTKKQAELRQIDVTFEVTNTALPGPGLSLGSFPTSGAANQRLEALTQRGVRTARVLQERREQRGQVLRLAAVDEALRTQLGPLQTALGNKTLFVCKS